MPRSTRRRSTAAALATVLALGLLAACGDEPDDCDTEAMTHVAAVRPVPPRPAARPAPDRPKVPGSGQRVHADDCD